MKVNSIMHDACGIIVYYTCHLSHSYYNIMCTYYNDNRERELLNIKL